MDFLDAPEAAPYRTYQSLRQLVQTHRQRDALEATAVYIVAVEVLCLALTTLIVPRRAMQDALCDLAMERLADLLPKGVPFTTPGEDPGLVIPVVEDMLPLREALTRYLAEAAGAYRLSEAAVLHIAMKLLADAMLGLPGWTVETLPVLIEQSVSVQVRARVETLLGEMKA